MKKVLFDRKGTDMDNNKQVIIDNQTPLPLDFILFCSMEMLARYFSCEVWSERTDHMTPKGVMSLRAYHKEKAYHFVATITLSRTAQA